MPDTPRANERVISDRMLIFLVGSVQFVNILDYMMVAPLGPDFSRALGIPISHIGYIGGAYTLAAAAAGIAGSFFLDRYDRRSALAVCLAGLVVATAAGGFAVGMGTLIAARLLAGAFGGPAAALALSIIADMIPPERRGKALGAVMGAFAVASVAGIPVGLELSRIGGWRLPFFAVAGLGLVLAALAIWQLPSLTRHIEIQKAGPPDPGLLHLLKQRTVQYSYAATAVTMMSSFVIIPNIPAYLLENLAYPRERFGLLYFVGGIVSFITTRTAGHLVDRFGSYRVGTAASILLTAVMVFGFLLPKPPVPLMLVFAGFMLAMGLRNVAYNTLTSQVPTPETRARFMSIQSAVQHFASASGAFLAARLLTETPDMKLVGMPKVASIGVVLALALPPLLRTVERHVRRQRPTRAQWELESSGESRDTTEAKDRGQPEISSTSKAFKDQEPLPPTL